MKPQVSTVDSDLMANVLEIPGPGWQEGEGRSWNGDSSVFREREMGEGKPGRRKETANTGPESLTRA